MSEATRGALAALAAGVAFGLGAPLAKRLVADVAPLPLASMLYLGGGLGLTVMRALRHGGGMREAPLRAEDAPTLVAMILVGGLLGPILMLTGLRSVSGVTGALLLNLEAPLTMLLAVTTFGEHLGRTPVSGAVLVLGAATALTIRPGDWGADALGVTAIVLACLAWALDNNLAARLALRDPVAVARWKTLGAGTIGVVLWALLGYGMPALETVIPALTVGFVSYGASIVLAVRAARTLGAARQAALFAIAPFAGAVGAVPILGESIGARESAVGAAMALGLGLLLREQHAHLHTHEPLAHDHVHEHDAHHSHGHAARVVGPHAHPHVHVPLTHAHPHRPDAHHRHRH